MGVWEAVDPTQSQKLLQAIDPDGGLMRAAYMQGTAGSSAADAMEGWDSTDMDDFQEASSEVEGVPPSLHLLADPTIPVLIPTTQVQPTSLHWRAVPTILSWTLSDIHTHEFKHI